MKIFLVLLVLTGFILACNTTVNSIKLTPEQQEYVARAMQQAIPVVVPKDKAEETWGRIQSFIGQYASMKIQIATDYIVETYNPDGSSFHYAYKAAKIVKGDTVEFALSCFSNAVFGMADKECARNVHLLAHYAATGELMPELIIR